MSDSGGQAKKGLRIAIYDTPKVVAKALSKVLNEAGYDVLYSGKLDLETARPDAHIWLAKWSYGLNGDFLRKAHPRLGIVSLSKGIEHIDKPEQKTAKDLGFRIVNCPHFSTISVAELALALGLYGIYQKSLLQPLSERPLIFPDFPDHYAEHAVAQMLFRNRMLSTGIARAKNFHFCDDDGLRPDVSWSGVELDRSKVLLVGKDLDAVNLARILRLGFNCDLYGYNTDEALDAYHVEQLGGIEFEAKWHEMDYIFLLTKKHGMLDKKNIALPDWPEAQAHPMSESLVAVLGTGNIGSKIALMARLGFGCRVTAFSRSRKHELDKLGIRYVDSVEEAISRANFIFSGLSLNDETAGIMDKKKLDSISGDIPRVIVNVTRDGIMDSRSLYEHLNQRSLVAYATDVPPNEAKLCMGEKPDEFTRAFIHHEKVIATPHEGDASRQSLERLCKEVIEMISEIVK